MLPDLIKPVIIGYVMSTFTLDSKYNVLERSHEDCEMSNR